MLTILSKKRKIKYSFFSAGFFSIVLALIISSSVHAEKFSPQWSAEFFNNVELSGEPVVTKKFNGGLAENWNRGNPANGIGNDYFSARFQTKIPGNQEYFVQTLSDDGIRVSVNGEKIIDHWRASDGEIKNGLITGLGSGEHTVEVDYFERSGRAYIYADIVPLNQWLVYYYNNTELSGTPVNKNIIDSDHLSLDYGYNSPIAKVSKNNFTARYVTAKHLEAGDYLIRTKVDDGVRVYVDGELVIDRWGSGNSVENATIVNIKDRDTASESEKDIHFIEVEYLEKAGKSILEFSIEPLNEKISTDKWLSLLYPNQQLSGTGVYHYVNTINYNWGYEAPNNQIGKNNFSGSFYKKIPGNQEYFVQTLSDDGIRVSVNGEKIIDHWKASDGEIKNGLITGLNSGQHTVEVDYFERSGKAYVYADIVPLNQWLVYYYNNTKLSGTPVNKNIIDSEQLSLDYGYNSPISKVSKNNYTARYVTAKHLEAGDYLIRTKVDDGVRVYVDGELVIDRWKAGNYVEDVAVINIKDRNTVKDSEKDIHFIEIEYLEKGGKSKLDFWITPISDNWIGTFYNNNELDGNPIYKEDTNLLEFNWGYDTPNSRIGKNNFSASFYKKFNGSQEYFIQTLSDDGVRVFVDNKKIIDQWKPVDGGISRGVITGLDSGTHTLKVDYFEKTGKAYIHADVVPLNQWLVYYYNSTTPKGIPTNKKIVDSDNLSEDYGDSSPMPNVSKDNFTARYVTAKRIKAGDYLFKVTNDDEVRIYVDGNLVLDSWGNDSSDDELSTIVSLTDKKTAEKDIHFIEIEYLHKSGKSKLDFSIEPLEQHLSTSNWLGVLYDNKDLSGNGVFLNNINQISFNWERNAPHKQIGTDYFSGSFFKKIEGKQDYFVQTLSDDGVRVFVDNKKIIDQWTPIDGGISRGVITGLDSDTHTVKVDYFENRGKACLYADIVPLNQWLVYYYNSTTPKGTPMAKKIIDSEYLLEDHGYNAPMPNVTKNDFTARYVTAKRLKAGDYLLNVTVDDGVRIYVDGNLVLDSWGPGNSVKKSTIVNIKDRKTSNAAEKDIHFIEIEYLEKGGKSYVEFFMSPITNDWSSMFYNNTELAGEPILGPTTKDLKHNWDYDAPIENVGNNNFSATFYKKLSGNQEYFIQTLSDDGVRVTVNNKKIIDHWNSADGAIKRALVTGLNSNSNLVTVDYLEKTGKAYIYADIVPLNQWLGYYYPTQSPHGLPVHTEIIKSEKLDLDYGYNAPAKNVPSDNYSARFVTAKRLEPGDYKVETIADDGVRVYIDGRLVIDRWDKGDSAVDTGIVTIQNKVNVSNAEKDIHFIEVHYIEYTGKSKISLDITKLKNSTIIYKHYNLLTFEEILNIQTNNSPKLDGQARFFASRSLVQYYLNPSNFSQNSPDYYQFLDLSRTFNLSKKEIDRINNYLKGTGKLEGTAATFNEAGQKFKVNPIYLIAHALHETGRGASELAKGVKVNGVYVYNFFGYAAYDDNAVGGGSQYAYSKGWTSPEKAILGGAEIIAKNYIYRSNGPQNTLYKMKWNPERPGHHQYATHVSWSLIQTKYIDDMYKLLDNPTRIYEVPKYKNQPGPTSRPAGEAQYAVISVPKGLTGTTTASSLNVRTYPNGDRIGAFSANTKVEIIGHNGGWYKVKANGLTGWVSGDYVKVDKAFMVTASTLNVRNTPSGSIIGTLYNGDIVFVATDNKGNYVISDGWYKIEFKNGYGWVSGRYLKEL